MWVLSEMMVNRNLKTKTGGNTCLDIEVRLNTGRAEDENDVEAVPKELLDLIDRHERDFSQTSTRLFM